MRGLIVALVLAVGCAAAGAPAADATFPGRNGELAYVWADYSGKNIFTWSGLGALDVPANGLNEPLWCVRDQDITTTEDCFVHDAAFSPDGERIAVVVSEPTEPDAHEKRYRLDVMAPGGGTLSSAPLDRPLFDLAWSPNGTRLLATRYDGPTGERDDGAPHVVLVTPRGEDLGEATPGSGSDADWSADGRIAFVHGRGIWMTRLGGTPRRLVARGAAPSWSPDGDALAFERDQRIWIMKRTGDLRRLSPGSRRSARAPAWSPDGRYIAFAAATASYPIVGPANDGIWIARTDGSCVRRLTPLTSATHGKPFWQPRPDAAGGRPPPTCRLERPDLRRGADRRVRIEWEAFRYAFTTIPRVHGRVVLRTRRRIAVPRRPGVRRRVTLARRRFETGPSGQVSVHADLSWPALRALRRQRRLPLTVAVRIRAAGGWRASARGRATLLPMGAAAQASSSSFSAATRRDAD